MIERRIRKSCSILLRIGAGFVLLFSGLQLMAQLPTATISGAIKDSSGAIIPDATVTATNSETGLARNTKSGSDGSYRFAALPV